MKNHPLDKITLNISSLAHDSRGIGFLADNKNSRGKAVFVEGALPGQLALCQKTKETSAFVEAELLEILDHGPNTVKPHCPHASACGGCPLQTMPYALQLQWKEKLIKDALIRIGGITAQRLEKSWNGLYPSPDITAFRNKIELAFGLDAVGQPALGFRRRGRHEVFNLKNCALVDASSLEIIRYFQSLLPEFIAADFAGKNPFLKNLILRADENLKDGCSWHALLLTGPSGAQKQEWISAIAEKLLQSIPQCASFSHEVHVGKSWSSQRKRRDFYPRRKTGGKRAEPELAYQIEGRIFRLSLSSFFQVNTRAAAILAKIVTDMDKKCSHENGLLDIYCGCGMPGLLLGNKYPVAYGIDFNKNAIENARLNAGNDSNWTFAAGDAGAVLEKQPKALNRVWSTVLVDPPRAGLDTKVRQKIKHALPENILYISCNPATLARDLKDLSTSYQLKELAAVDLFPHTPHAECCVLLEKIPC